MYRYCDVTGCVRRSLHWVSRGDAGKDLKLCTVCVIAWMVYVPPRVRDQALVTLFHGALVPGRREDWRTSLAPTLMTSFGNGERNYHAAH